MSHPGETIADGAAPRCEDCGRMPKLDVHRSAAGYYIGTWCDCGPYTRESGYYRTRELAQADLDSGPTDAEPTRPARSVRTRGAARRAIAVTR